MRYIFTTIEFDGGDGWIIGYVEELPGVIVQGRTRGELRRNLSDGAKLVLHHITVNNREDFQPTRAARRGQIRVNYTAGRRPRGLKVINK